MNIFNVTISLLREKAAAMKIWLDEAQVNSKHLMGCKRRLFFWSCITHLMINLMPTKDWLVEEGEEARATDIRLDEGIRTMFNDIDEKTRHVENARHTKETCPVEKGHTTKETCHVQTVVHVKNAPEITNPGFGTKHAFYNQGYVTSQDQSFSNPIVTPITSWEKKWKTVMSSNTFGNAVKLNEYNYNSSRQTSESDVHIYSDWGGKGFSLCWGWRKWR